MKRLVILIGNARGGEKTWKTMFQHLIDPLSADLALCFGDTKNKNNILYQNAQYIWEIPEYKNWADYYSIYFTNKWKDSFLVGASSGLAGGIDTHIGSGAIGCAFRHFIKNNYTEVLKKYDQIILTRSDHYYLHDHPILDNKNFWIIEGEDHHGLCDRHHVFSSEMIDDVLGIAEYMDSNIGYNNVLNQGCINIESVLCSFFNHNGIIKKIERIPRVQFLVNTSEDHTRWSVGTEPLPGHQDLYIKYINEYRTTIDNIKKLINLTN